MILKSLDLKLLGGEPDFGKIFEREGFEGQRRKFLKVEPMLNEAEDLGSDIIQLYASGTAGVEPCFEC